jgi:hypothetical protein
MARAHLHAPARAVVRVHVMAVHDAAAAADASGSRRSNST